jgi:hypothetical protein
VWLVDIFVCKNTITIIISTLTCALVTAVAPPLIRLHWVAWGAASFTIKASRCNTRRDREGDVSNYYFCVQKTVLSNKSYLLSALQNRAAASSIYLEEVGEVWSSWLQY